jgi:hypothetical protein
VFTIPNGIIGASAKERNAKRCACRDHSGRLQ